MDLTALYSMAEKLEISYVTAVVITGLSAVSYTHLVRNLSLHFFRCLNAEV